MEIFFKLLDQGSLHSLGGKTTKNKGARGKSFFDLFGGVEIVP